jgi:hypothetical protein
MSGRGPAIPNGPIHYLQVPATPCPCPSLVDAMQFESMIWPHIVYPLYPGSTVRLAVGGKTPFPGIPTPAHMPYTFEIAFPCRNYSTDDPDTCR